MPKKSDSPRIIKGHGTERNSEKATISDPENNDILQGGEWLSRTMQFWQQGVDLGSIKSSVNFVWLIQNLVRGISPLLISMTVGKKP